MLKKLLLFLFLCLPLFLAAQLSLRVTSLPANTPANPSIFVAGNFNNWNAGASAYELVAQSDGSFTLTLTPSPGLLEFKFTRGSWATVEGGANGGFRPNRTLNYNGGMQEVNIVIQSWEDQGGDNSTASDNVSVLSTDFYMPQLDRNRKVWIYLPPNYYTSDLTYPVLYMHDGQNVFDASTSFSGEWEVDESLNDLFENGDNGAIVVAIDNGGANRLNEYSPWVNSTYGGGQGDEYIDFIVETLKPHIDANYRTNPDRESTGIAGSSMGGLISMYALIEHQDVFSKAGIFSPAFWFAPEAYSHVSSIGKEADVRIYFVAGQSESATMVPNMQAMYNTCINAGFSAEELFFLTHADGAHSEWYWRREFPAAYEWLFDQVTSITSAGPAIQQVRLSPNPTDYILKISSERVLQAPKLQIYAVNGTLIQPPTIIDGDTFNVSFLQEGTYIFNIYDGKVLVGAQRIVVSR
ncbi:MAG: alpha/beta hydrolase-fold protein [Bacteroidota bacterium]